MGCKMVLLNNCSHFLKCDDGIEVVEEKALLLVDTAEVFRSEGLVPAVYSQIVQTHT